jgi:hypothetical protein
LSKSAKLKGQVATVVIQSTSEAGDGEGLAGGSSDKKVNWSILIALNCGEVAMQRHIRIMMF